jgi:hypothetical protein
MPHGIAWQNACMRIGDIWAFPAGSDVLIVAGRVPPAWLPPFADRFNTNYTRYLNSTDLDSLIAIKDRIAHTSPRCRVHTCTSNDLMDEIAGGRSPLASSHVVSIGGTWNALTAWLTRSLDLPVVQLIERGDAFAVPGSDGDPPLFRHLLHPGVSGLNGVDIGVFVRAPNAWAPGHTVTICNGVTAFGVLGMTTAFIDDSVRAANEALVSDAGSAVCLLARVAVEESSVPAPDLTLPESLLHCWSRAGDGNWHAADLETAPGRLDSGGERQDPTTPFVAEGNGAPGLRRRTG